MQVEGHQFQVTQDDVKEIYQQKEQAIRMIEQYEQYYETA